MLTFQERYINFLSMHEEILINCDRIQEIKHSLYPERFLLPSYSLTNCSEITFDKNRITISYVLFSNGSQGELYFNVSELSLSHEKIVELTKRVEEERVAAVKKYELEKFEKQKSKKMAELEKLTREMKENGFF